MKLPTCTGQVSVHFYSSVGFGVSELPALQQRRESASSCSPDLSATAPALLTSVPHVGIALSYQGSWCESPSLWVSLEVPQKGMSFGQDIGVVHC